MTTLKLVRVSDLIGKDVSGLQADFRSRYSDGSLMHSHQEETGPIAVTMESVEYRTEKTRSPTLKREYGKDRLKLMYWTCDRHPSGCNYSGIVAEDERHHEIFIMLEVT
jgi:hypothetical protein